MAVFNSLTIDGINSLDYGIYITGEAVYNAPERAIEMVTIPGRNGALAIDQGRYENIEVTYPAGCFAVDKADFARKISAFRNILASRYSYKRITDTYNPDEYRLGLFRSGMVVSPNSYNRAGEFDIVFDCKPQRFLVDGEEPMELTATDVLTDHNLEAITDHNGNPFTATVMIHTLTNPTPFECKPLIVVNEACTIRINSQSVTVTSGTFPVYIDCDMMQIYCIGSGGAITNASNRVAFSPRWKFPVMPSGDMTFSSTSPQIEIIPRWWIL